MTDDIVERLRLQAQTYTREPWHSELYKEAADEIERLRLLAGEDDRGFATPEEAEEALRNITGIPDILRGEQTITSAEAILSRRRRDPR